MQQTLYNDPDHWSRRSEEARAIAGQMKDPEAQRLMLGIAEGYERLAEHAARRAKHKTSDAHA
jgi:hypothetical protein